VTTNTDASLEKFKLERRNPLPPGRYWQDIFKPQFSAFDNWLVRNRDHLDVLTTEHFDAPGIEITDPAGFGTTERQWILFRVIEPVKWEGPGLPTIATDDIRSSGDTERPTDDIVPPNDAGGIFKVAALAAGAIVLAGVVLNKVLNKVVG